MTVNVFEIGVDDLHKALKVLNEIPEFDEYFIPDSIKKRIVNKQTIFLIAEFAGKVIGCKIAYNRYYDGSIYSWLGGVLPIYRRQGVATALQKELERLALKRFFNSIKMKTRNTHSEMLRFAIKQDYLICNFHKKETLLESRIEMIKVLNHE